MTGGQQLQRAFRELLSQLREGDASGVESGAAAQLRDTPPGRLLAVDAVLRERRAEADLRGAGIGVVGLLSMQRDGYVREAATRALRGRTEPLAFRLLLVRCNDVVGEVAAAAEEGLGPWLTPGRAPALVAALPLLEALRTTVRAAHSPSLARVDVLLQSTSRHIDAALREAATSSADADTRRVAIASLAARDVEILAVGLRDADPRVRLSSARIAASKGIPIDARRALLPALEANAAPAVRLLALRMRQQGGSEADAQAVADAVLDPNAAVRYYARRFVARLGRTVDTRGRALACLREPSASPRALVGALAALSDVGRSEDAPAIRRYADAPASRVRREARRTLALLDALPA